MTDRRNPDAISQVVIVGGGTAGWMTALYLRLITRPLGVSITLVESPTVGIIGVGEATIPSIVEYLRTLKIDEHEFMRRCSASFKLAIKFDEWRGPGSSYWHAFGLCGGQINGLDLFHFWMRQRREGRNDLAYTDYSVHARLCEGAKAPWDYGATSPIFELGSYAYHLDAGALADYLKELATAAGVKHLHGHVESVKIDERGLLTSIDIGGERSLAADLFIDATGFHGRLIEREFGDPWIDWSRYLLCDSAVAMPLPRDETFAPYTLSTALPAGWVWRIPLQSRVGLGYVHSRAHVSEDEAIASLIARSGLKQRAADPRSLRMRIGRRSNFWVRNCVSIGLAAGFVEPLESTGIHLSFRGVKLLVEYWPDRHFNPATIAAYNQEMATLFDEVRDFIILHYMLSDRPEPFWRDVQNAPLPASFTDRLALYDEIGHVKLDRRPVFLEPNYHFIFSGNGRLPKRGPVGADLALPEETRKVLDQIRTQNAAFARQAPKHRDYLTRLSEARP